MNISSGCLVEDFDLFFCCCRCHVDFFSLFYWSKFILFCCSPIAKNSIFIVRKINNLVLNCLDVSDIILTSAGWFEKEEKKKKNPCFRCDVTKEIKMFFFNNLIVWCAWETRIICRKMTKKEGKKTFVKDFNGMKSKKIINGKIC